MIVVDLQAWRQHEGKARVIQAADKPVQVWCGQAHLAAIAPYTSASFERVTPSLAWPYPWRLSKIAGDADK